MKTIGILGSGNVGQVLAKGFLNHGHTVVMGTSHPEKLTDFKQAHPEVTIENFKRTVELSDMIVLAVKGLVAEQVVREVRDEISGKTVIDTTNPLTGEPPDRGVLKLSIYPGESLMEKLQAVAAEAHFVKAFNSVGNELMVDPDFGGQKPTMFYCGNDERAKYEVLGIINQFGWEGEDMGTAASARALEQLVVLWCIPAFLGHGRRHAFKLLR